MVPSSYSAHQNQASALRWVMLGLGGLGTMISAWRSGREGQHELWGAF